MPFSKFKESYERANTLDHRDLLCKGSLLEKQVNLMAVVSMVVYIVLSMGTSRMWTSGYFPMCRREENFPEWLNVMPFGSSFAFLSSAVLQLLFATKYFVGNAAPEKPLLAMHSGVMVVLILAGASHLQAYTQEHVVCVDGFGVDSLIGQWAEWMVTVPLLAYLGCAVVSKDALSFLDWVMLANAASMILTGFLMTVDPDRKWLYLAISTVNFFLVPAIVTAMDEADKTSVRSVSFDGTMSIDDANLYIVSLQRRWRRQIFDRFFLVCGFFPAVFGLQACGVISRDVGIASFLVGSLLGKLVFSSVFAQSYLALSLEMSTVSHSIVRSHETRRSFLRYVFHELRVPLHTLTMGMPLLLDLVGPRESLSTENAQLIDMVHASTASLVDNMSQVLTLHRLREGEIPRQPTVLRLDQLLMDELYRAQEQMQVLKGLSLSLSCSSSLSSSSSASASASTTQDGTESALYVEGSEEYLRILVQGVLGALGGCVKGGSAIRVQLTLEQPTFPTAAAKESKMLAKLTTQAEEQDRDRLFSFTALDSSIQQWRDCNVAMAHHLIRLEDMLFPLHSQVQRETANAPQLEDAQDRTFYMFFSMADLLLGFDEMMDQLEAGETVLRATDTSAQGAGMGMVLVAEVLRTLPGGKLTYINGGREQQGVLLSFQLPAQWMAVPNDTNCVDGQTTATASADSAEECSSSGVHGSVIASTDPSGSEICLKDTSFALRSRSCSDSVTEEIDFDRESVASQGSVPEQGDPSPSAVDISQPLPPSKSPSPPLPPPDPPAATASPFRRPPRRPTSHSAEVTSTASEASTSPGKYFMSIGRRCSSPTASVEQTVTLPPSLPPSMPPSASSSRSGSPHSFVAGDLTSRPRWNILVVDDAPSNSKMLCHALSRRGHVCVVAENGWEAVLLMREDIRRFDMVFMDYTMPVMTGSDATRILREELHYEGYVIGVTGNVLPDDMSRFVASGANLVLLKPLRSPDLDLVLGYIAGHGLQCDLTRRLSISSRREIETYAFSMSTYARSSPIVSMSGRDI